MAESISLMTLGGKDPSFCTAPRPPSSKADRFPFETDAATRAVAAGAFNSASLAGNRALDDCDALGPILERVAALREVAEAFGVSLQAAALQFPMAHPAVVSVVSGARTAEQIRWNIAGYEAEVTNAFWVDSCRLRPNGEAGWTAVWPLSIAIRSMQAFTETSFRLKV